MEILVKRIARKETYTIGQMYINGVYVCDTLEDADRLYFGKPKVYGETAIPCGRYDVNLDSYSPKFGAKEPYKSVCNGLVPLIERVPNFSGVRVHCGNNEKYTEGCLLVGKNTQKGMVTDSRETFTYLMKHYLNHAREMHDRVCITIK